MVSVQLYGLCILGSSDETTRTDHTHDWCNAAGAAVDLGLSADSGAVWRVTRYFGSAASTGSRSRGSRYQARMGDSALVCAWASGAGGWRIDLWRGHNHRVANHS